MCTFTRLRSRMNRHGSASYSGRAESRATISQRYAFRKDAVRIAVALIVFPAAIAQVPARPPLPTHPERPGNGPQTMESFGCRWDDELRAYRCATTRAQDFASYAWFRPGLADFAHQIAKFMRSLEGGPRRYAVLVQGFADCVFRPRDSDKKYWENLPSYNHGEPTAPVNFLGNCSRKRMGLIQNEDVAFLRSCLTAILLRDAIAGATTVEEMTPKAYKETDKNYCGPTHRAVEIYLRRRGGTGR
jgi:hypothetical protein